MIDTYWDFYIVYIDKCVRENYANDLDPEHYYMEWNHWLPKCLFKGHGPGQWLTFKQHAIASALQTLGLRENCMTGMMKEYLPKELLELAWPYYCLAQSERMKLRTGELAPMFGRTGELCPAYGRTGELCPAYGKKNPAQSERMKKQIGELNPLFGRKWWVNSEGETYRGFESPGPEWQNGRPAQSERMKKQIGELNPSYGKKWWVNAQGETYKGVEAPGPDWQNGRKWRFTP